VHAGTRIDESFFNLFICMNHLNEPLEPDFQSLLHISENHLRTLNACVREPFK